MDRQNDSARGVDQIVVVVAQLRRPTFDSPGSIWIGRRHFLLKLPAPFSTYHNDRTRTKCPRSAQRLAVADGQAHSGGCSVVAAGKTRRWMIIPVAIDGEIPVELAPEFDIVRTIKSEVHSSRLRNSG